MKLRVWWIPQMPMDTPFYVAVESAIEAKKLIGTLAKYDLYQLENNIKPDYSNAGGLEMFEEGEWVEWQDDNGYTLDELDRVFSE